MADAIGADCLYRNKFDKRIDLFCLGSHSSIDGSDGTLRPFKYIHAYIWCIIITFLLFVLINNSMRLFLNDESKNARSPTEQLNCVDRMAIILNSDVAPDSYAAYQFSEGRSLQLIISFIPKRHIRRDWTYHLIKCLNILVKCDMNMHKFD